MLAGPLKDSTVACVGAVELCHLQHSYRPLPIFIGEQREQYSRADAASLCIFCPQVDADIAVLDVVRGFCL